MIIVHVNSIYFNQSFVAHLLLVRPIGCSVWQPEDLCHRLERALTSSLVLPRCGEHCASCPHSLDGDAPTKLWDLDLGRGDLLRRGGLRMEETGQASTGSGRELWRQLVQVAKDLQNSGDQLAVQTIEIQRWMRGEDSDLGESQFLLFASRWWILATPGHA